jgi:hypothetical protein
VACPKTHLDWFLFGSVSRSTIRQECVLVGIVVLGFFYLERGLLLGRLTYVHDTILWYPVFHYFAESLWLGTWALWDPYVHGGEPFHYAWGILRLLDPLTLISIGLGRIMSVPLFDLYHYQYVLRLLVAVAGVYAVARHLLHRFLSVYVVLIVGLWGYLACGSLTAVGSIDAFCWFPWALFCLLKTVDAATQRRSLVFLSFWYCTGVFVGAAIYHWVYGVFVLTVFALSLLLNHREEVGRFLSVNRLVWLAGLALFAALVAPLVALAPERREIVPTVRVYDRDRTPSALSRVLGVDYQDIRDRSPQVGLGSYQIIGSLLPWTADYEFPHTSFLARVLLLVGVLFGVHRYRYNLLVAAALTVFLYAGPVWPLERLHQALYLSFPPLWLARHLSLFDPYVYFFALVFIGLGTDRVLEWLSRPWSGGVERRRRAAGAALTAGLGICGLMWLGGRNIFVTMYPLPVATAVAFGAVVGSAIGALAWYHRRAPTWFTTPLLAGFSILVLEQWTIAAYLERPGVFSWTAPADCGCFKQSRAEYFKDLRFPTEAVHAFRPPDDRVAGLDLKQAHLSHLPALVKVNTALEDLLPPRNRGAHVFPDAFGMSFPMGLYHFWLPSYFELYEIGEQRPAVFAALMGIGKPIIEFFPRVLTMSEPEQARLFATGDAEDVRELLERAVFLPRPLPSPFRAWAPTPDAFRTVVAEDLNGSFEQWGSATPLRWTFSQGGTGGQVARFGERDARHGRWAVRLTTSSTGPSFLRYAMPDIGRYRGRELTVRAWVKSANTVPGAVQMDLQTKPGSLLNISYRNSGEWEELIVRHRVEDDAAYILVSLSVGAHANSSADFDDVRITVSKPVEAGEFTSRVVSYAPSRLELEVWTDRDGVLLFRDNFHHGWSARVDGVPANLERANLSFKALPLRQGDHRVLFQYRPGWFLVSLYSYLAANVVFVSLVIGLGLRGRSAH